MRRDKDRLEAELAEMRQRWRGKHSPARRLALSQGRNAIKAKRKREQVASMYQAGASIPDIAEALDMSIGSVRTQLRRAGVSARSYSEAVRLAWSQSGKFSGRNRTARVNPATRGSKQPGCQWEWCGVSKLCSDCAEAASYVPFR